MKFLNPWGFLFGLSIPGIIILYLLKQQHQDVIISSTFLWDKTIENAQASVPWQKLRRNILLFIQILALALFTIGLSQPILVGKGHGEDYIIILDSSASMQATDIKPSRFEKAIDDIEKLIDGMLPHQSMTLIEGAGQSKILANQTSDKSTLKARLGQVKATNEVSNINEAFSLVQGIIGEETNAQVYLYTDNNHIQDDMGDISYNTMIYNNHGQNRAVQSVTYSYDSDNPVVLSTIVNHGNLVTLSVECLVDDRLVDVKEIDIAEEEMANIYWDNIPKDGQRVEINIIDEDDLMVDNRGWVVINPPSTNKILMVTSRNTFLEKAIAIRRDVQLDKTTFEQAQDIEGYNLYIYDGYLPSEIPTDGSIILINPKGRGDIINIGETFNPGAVKVSSQSSYSELINYVQAEDFHIAEANTLEIPNWAESVLDDGQHPIMLAGQRESQRIVVLPFDIHNSDLPLKADFPILIQNIMEWMLPQVVDDNMGNFAGNEVNINPLPHAQKVVVTSPAGIAENIAPPYPVPPFRETQEVGIYKVEQSMVKDKKIEGYFTIQIETDKESDLSLVQYSDTGAEMQEDSRTNPDMGKNIWHYFIWAVLILILIEWWVYQRGY